MKKIMVNIGSKNKMDCSEVSVPKALAESVIFGHVDRWVRQWLEAGTCGRHMLL